MNCAECKELLVGYVEGFLDDSRMRAVAEHLRGCSSCRGQVQEIEGLRERLVTNGKALAGSDLENGVMNRIIREQKIQLKAQGGPGEAPNIWRIIMKSTITKLAVAAAILIAVGIGFHFIGNPLGATVTFAEVIEPILNARTVILDLIIGDEETGPVMHEIVVGPRMRRTISNMENMIHIIDLESGNMLLLDTEEQTAVYVDIQGSVQERTRSYVEFLRKMIVKVQDNYEKLGEQEIDGQKAIGFVARGPNEEVKVWADPETALPIRIELRVGQLLAIMKNFKFDEPIEDSLMSMDVPAGYTLEQNELDLTGATEQDFVESLRVWAEVLLDGTFPEDIGTENAMKQVPLLGEKVAQLDLSDEEKTQLGMSFGRGMLFLQIYETGGKWHYAGKGVKLGDAGKAIFWYQPEGSETYRVIYGDLHVEDVAPENLPR